MPLPAFLLAVPPFLMDIAPSIVGGLAGGVLMNGFQKKPTTLEKVDIQVDRFLKYAKVAEVLVGGADWIFGTKAKRADLDAKKLEFDVSAAGFDARLKQAQAERAELELQRMRDNEDYRGEVGEQQAMGMAGLPKRSRTTKKATASPPSRRAAT